MGLGQLALHLIGGAAAKNIKYNGITLNSNAKPKQFRTNCDTQLKLLSVTKFINLKFFGFTYLPYSLADS